MRRGGGEGLASVEASPRERVVYEDLPEDVLRIPIYDLSAGGGLEPNGELVESRGETVRRWLREEVGINPEDAFLARVMGDSMVPLLHPGDLALGRLGDSYIGEGVYALWYEDEFYVKTVERRGATKVRLLSKNPDYEPIFLHEGDKIRLLGRVLRRFTGLY
ncbi:MAG: S24 family peptidase [Bacteroidetes bacterium]|nr:S24 family peptidase [Bacteroidota bacterium]